LPSQENVKCTLEKDWSGWRGSERAAFIEGLVAFLRESI